MNRLGRKKERVPVKVLPELGVFGICKCGGSIRYYDDCGVKCDKCSKLHGIRVFRRHGGGFK